MGTTPSRAGRAVPLLWASLAITAAGFLLAPPRTVLDGLLGRWIEPTLYQPWLIEDPVTGTWRGATEDDYAEAFAEAD